MSEFGEIQKEFAEIADFLVVYIQEVHVKEGWFFENGKTFHLHKTVHDRVREAQALSKQAPWAQVMADGMNDDAMLSYGALPERLYIIQDGVVAYEGDIGPRGYHPKEVRDWLAEYRLRENNN